MKVLIIVKSRHNDNTLKIAEAMSEVAPVTLTTFEDVSRYKLDEYDIVGLGSGIYYGKHDKQLLKFVRDNCNKIKSSFVFSTSGSTNFEKNNRTMVKLLESNNVKVLGSYGCKGLDKFFIFALFGGMNKGHPNMDDFDSAQQFIEQIITKYNEIK